MPESRADEDQGNPAFYILSGRMEKAKSKSEKTNSLDSGMRRNDRQKLQPLPLPLPHPPPHDNGPEHHDEHGACEVGGAHRAEPEAVRAEAAHRGASE